MTPKVKTVPVSSLDEPDSNPNSMPEREFGLLVRAIRSEGFLQPVLVRDTGGGRFQIVDGVHRVRAAREVGLDKVQAVVLPADYPEEKARLIQIGMNRLRGDLDLYAVAHTLRELDAANFDLELSGFSKDEIGRMLAPLDDDVQDHDFVISDPEPQSPQPASDDEEEPVATLTLELTRSEVRRAKTKLKKLGGGDISQGFRAIMGWTD